jgi:serine/threonine protein kinase
MQLVCRRCQRTLEYSGDCPSFCGYCGNHLAVTPGESATTTETPVAEMKEDITADAPAQTLTAAVSHHPPGSAPEPAFPETVGGYRLLRRLGKGGMGSVYEAEDSATGRHVALKLISPDFIASADAVERFRQEGRLASTISHPRCVFVLAADEYAGQPYIVMELMPGSTLKDLVTEKGALAPVQAITLILDVIEGLAEAHQHGVIHRDVKPSNCFLEAGGRVKIGDFGLSKSLASDSHLTKTGAFLGTPLFASPEQVRGEPLDPRTDVYSVAATLYYLLVGRAPFEGGSAGSTMARLVSDPAPPMRGLRPEIPAPLDRVVLQGLERKRERRWQSLEEFRQALMPFVPGKLSIGGLGIRFGAMLLDSLILSPVSLIIGGLTIWLHGGINLHPTTADTLINTILGVLPTLLYYTITEGLWGCSLGKWLLRLRVCTSDGQEAPGLARGFLRALFYLAITNGPGFLFSMLTTVDEEFPKEHPFLVLASVYLVPIAVIGTILSTMRARNGYRGPYEFLSGTRVIRLPWRTRRKLYLTGTWERTLTQPDGLPRQIGPFEIQGALLWTDHESVLLGLDKSLSRKVWLWLRPQTHAGLSQDRHDLGRATRSRWLAGGALITGDFQWNAFLAPTGCSLREAVANSGKFTWADARPVLEELAEELSAAVADGSLPDALTVDQVWIQAHGRVLLLDFPIHDSVIILKEGSVEQAPLALLGEAAVLMLEGQPRGVDDSAGPVRAPLPVHVNHFLPRLLGWPKPYKRIEQFQTDLKETEDRPMEVGRGRRAGHLVLIALSMFMGFSCCLMPLYISARSQYVGHLTAATREAERILDGLDDKARLPGDEDGKEIAALRGRLKEKQTGLESEREAWRGTLSWLEATRVNLTDGIKIGVQPPTKAAPAALRKDAETLLARDLRSEVRAESMAAMSLAGTCFLPVLWIIWAFLFRGGFSYHLTGMSLVRKDGRKAARWQCAARSFLFWLPMVALCSASIGLDLWFWSVEGPHAGWILAWLPQLSTALWLAGLLTFPAYAVLALRSPTRSLHDRLVGTYLVPR